MARLMRRARCATCGEAIPRDAEVCPACGAQVVRREHTYRCAGCGARVPIGAACPICGVERARRNWSRLGRFLGIVMVSGALLVTGLWAWQRLDVNEAQVVMGPTATATSSPYPTQVPSATPTRTTTPTSTLVPTTTPSPMLSATPTVAPSATPVVETYVVVAGDSPIGVARRFGMDVQRLLNLNGLKSDAILQVDQELVIVDVNAGTPQPTETMLLGQGGVTAAPTNTVTLTPTATPGLLVHVVAPGDMLGSLAVAYDVDSETIAEANNIGLTAILHVGQELVIPGMTPTPSVTPTATATPTATDAATPLPTIPPRPTQLAFRYRNPMALAPTDRSIMRGAEADVVLNWTSVGILAEDEWYEVSLASPCHDNVSHHWTKATSWRLPAEAFCQDPESAAFEWSVRVAQRTGPEQPAAAQSPPSKTLSFWWQP